MSLSSAKYVPTSFQTQFSSPLANTFSAPSVSKTSNTAPFVNATRSRLWIKGFWNLWKVYGLLNVRTVNWVRWVMKVIRCMFNRKRGRWRWKRSKNRKKKRFKSNMKRWLHKLSKLTRRRKVYSWISILSQEKVIVM